MLLLSTGFCFFYGVCSFLVQASSFLAMSMPISRQPNHMTWMGTVKTASCMMAGPGHNPAMPQPRPKQEAPRTNFQSISAPLGLKSYVPR